MMATAMSNTAQSVQPEQIEQTEQAENMKLTLTQTSPGVFTHSWKTKQITTLTADKAKEHNIRVSFFNNGCSEMVKDATLKHTWSGWNLEIPNKSGFKRDIPIVRESFKFLNSSINNPPHHLFRATLKNTGDVDTILATGVNLNLQAKNGISNTIICKFSYHDWYFTSEDDRDSKYCKTHLRVHIARMSARQFDLCDTDIQTCRFTALHFAVFLTETNSISRFIDNGLSVDVTDGNGRTPLFQAILIDNTGAVKELLKHNPSLMPTRYQHILSTAMRISQFDIVKLILNHIHSMANGDNKRLLIEKAFKGAVLGGRAHNVEQFLLLFPEQYMVIDRKSALLTTLNSKSTAIFFKLMAHSIKNKKWGDDYARLNASKGVNTPIKILEANNYSQVAIQKYSELFNKMHMPYLNENPTQFSDAEQTGVNPNITAGNKELSEAGSIGMLGVTGDSTICNWAEDEDGYCTITAPKLETEAAT